MNESSTAALIAFALAHHGSEEAWQATGTLHGRGSREVFDAADILGQLGWAERLFLRESVELLIDLLGDRFASVVAAAATALGHRNDPRAIPHLVRLVEHPDAAVRFGVVQGLSRHDHDDAIAGLIALSRDVDRDVRNWATFGLGSQTALDTPAIREALCMRTGEEDPEVRGEAILGLARRRDGRALEIVRRELRGAFHGDWAVEAAECLADPTLLPLLERTWATLDESNRAHFERAFQAALAACRPDEP